MLTDKFKEETRVEMYFFLGLLLLILGMILLNLFLKSGSENAPIPKEKHKTVIIRDTPKSGETAKPPAKAVVATVTDIIKQADYSTAYMEINHVPKNSPQYNELNKIITEEKLKRKAPTVRKNSGVSSASLVRYLDESTPRDRSSDALYIYFVDIAGTYFPSFCIQNSAKRALGITEFIISADRKKFTIKAPAIKRENNDKGVSEWLDVPLDKNTFAAVQAIISAKKVSLTAVGTKATSSRDLTENEIKGIRRVLDGFAAVGGNMNYLREVSVPLPAQKTGTGKRGDS